MPQTRRNSIEPTDNKPFQFPGTEMRPTDSVPSNVTSITSSIITPMPAPGSSKAPKVIGQRPTYLLEQIRTLGRLAGIEDPDELVDWIVWYSSDDERCGSVICLIGRHTFILYLYFYNKKHTYIPHNTRTLLVSLYFYVWYLFC